MGEQPLYQVHVELLDADGNPIDSASKRIGLRELKIILPENGNPLHFEVNGVPFFAKGGNWIPCDSFTSRVTPEILRRYVADAAAVNMNSCVFGAAAITKTTRCLMRATNWAFASGLISNLPAPRIRRLTINS